MTVSSKSVSHTAFQHSCQLVVSNVYIYFLFSITLATCDASQFECTSGECISNIRYCDGIADCRDESDENNCPSPGTVLSFYHHLMETHIIHA